MKKKIRSFLDFMASRPYIKSKKKVSSLDELEDDPHEFWKKDLYEKQYLWDQLETIRRLMRFSPNSNCESIKQILEKYLQSRVLEFRFMASWEFIRNKNLTCWWLKLIPDTDDVLANHYVERGELNDVFGRGRFLQCTWESRDSFDIALIFAYISQYKDGFLWIDLGKLTKMNQDLVMNSDMSNDKSDDEKEQTNIPEKKPKDLDSFYELDDDERQSVPYLDDESYDEEDQTNEPEKDQEQSDYSYIHPETSPEDRKKDYLNLRKQIRVTKKKPISTIDYADIKTQMNNLRKSEMGPNSYVGRSQEHLERAVSSFYTSHNWKKPEKKIISVENAGEYDYTLKKSEAFQKVRIGIMVPSDTKMNYNTRFESFYIIVKKKNYEIQLGGDGNSFKKMILEDSHVRGELNDLIKAIQDEIIVSS